MYCKKCGAENLGDAQVCQGCGGVFVYSETPRTSGMAITSMILGISGFSMFGVFGVTWIIGLIFGIVALQKISKSGGRIKGKGWAITGVVTSASGLALVLTILGVWLVFTSVNTAKLRKQITELKQAMVDETIYEVPSIEGFVSIINSKGDDNDCSSELFDAEALTMTEGSSLIEGGLDCDTNGNIPIQITWSFAGVKDNADVYNFKIVFPVIDEVPLLTINKSISYDGSEQVIYEDDAVKIVIKPEEEN